MIDLADARALVAAALELSPEEVPADADVESLAAWDSLGHVKVVLAVEARLGRPLASAELAQFRSLADAARLLADTQAA